MEFFFLYSHYECDILTVSGPAGEIKKGEKIFGIT
jgi:hypothetical protein